MSKPKQRIFPSARLQLTKILGTGRGCWDWPPNSKTQGLAGPKCLSMCMHRKPVGSVAHSLPMGRVP